MVIPMGPYPLIFSLTIRQSLDMTSIFVQLQYSEQICGSLHKNVESTDHAETKDH
jgi:hypothetical protein